MTRTSPENEPCKPENPSCGCGTGPGCTVESILSIDDRGQMVLPKDVRDKAKLKSGDKLALISWEKDGEVCCLVLMKVEGLSGMVRDLIGPVIQQQAGERDRS
jgi:antitoxin PrlF